MNLFSDPTRGDGYVRFPESHPASSDWSLVARREPASGLVVGQMVRFTGQSFGRLTRPPLTHAGRNTRLYVSDVRKAERSVLCPAGAEVWVLNESEVSDD